MPISSEQFHVEQIADWTVSFYRETEVESGDIGWKASVEDTNSPYGALVVQMTPIADDSDTEPMAMVSQLRKMIKAVIIAYEDHDPAEEG